MAPGSQQLASGLRKTGRYEFSYAPMPGLLQTTVLSP